MPSVVPVSSVAGPDSSEGRSPADAEPPIGLCVDIVHVAGGWGALSTIAEVATAAAAAVSAELGVTRSEACIALSSDAQVAQLNATYRGKPQPTNVLSFPAKAPAIAGQARILGDVVLAAETVSREAAALGLPLTSHLQHLVVHGLLHLLGYDHEQDEEAHAMEALEIRILARLGVANPYEVAGAPHSSCQQQTEFLES